jgi:hypothetical protein
VPVLVRVLIAAVLVAAAGGCTPRPAEQPAAPSVAPVEAAQLDAMTPSEKQSSIAASFPLEVPVPTGEVVRGEAQGDDAWDYEIVVDAPAPSVAEWYRQAYGARSWELVSETPVGSAEQGAGTELTFRKGGAESRVTVVEEGEIARASVILGVGVPVLETQ